MTDRKAEVLITRAASTLRKAANADRKRRAELNSMAEYLESIIYERELGFDKPMFDDAPPVAGDPTLEVKKLMKPFKVRLTR
ncbi:MAG: hypothetical protein FJX59_17540 [Alphaproteobacteria bacterium]|nr:hypothetical protein [Alphaproteobacteria bacterium]